MEARIVIATESRGDAAVRTRRAYFDCRFGQLHVRTAFPVTGGFDESVTLFCLHSSHGSSRIFTRFLSALADSRSVYAPDLPGFGESDSSPARSVADAAAAMLELANALRLGQIDLLGIEYGAEAAVALAALRPELVRRLVLVGPSVERLPAVKQQRLMLNAAEHRDETFEAAPDGLVKQVGSFLSRS